MAVELGRLQQKGDIDEVEVVPGLEVPESARKGLMIASEQPAAAAPETEEDRRRRDINQRFIEPEGYSLDQNTQGTCDAAPEDRKQEDITPYEL